MLEAAKAILRQNLKQELSLREKQAAELVRMANMAQHQGLPGMDQALWDMWRQNEVEQLSLQAKIEALDS
jgi:hypothetical protein